MTRAYGKIDDEVLTFKSQKTFERGSRRTRKRSMASGCGSRRRTVDEKTVTYAEALEAALCYGWIDGLKRAYDDESFIQRFTPRRSRSVWSKVNVGHVDRLTKEGRMSHPGLAAVEAAKSDGRWDRAYESQKNVQIPADFLRELEEGPESPGVFRKPQPREQIRDRLPARRRQKARDTRAPDDEVRRHDETRREDPPLGRVAHYAVPAGSSNSGRDPRAIGSGCRRCGMRSLSKVCVAAIVVATIGCGGSDSGILRVRAMARLAAPASSHRAGRWVESWCFPPTTRGTATSRAIP